MKFNLYPELLNTIKVILAFTKVDATLRFQKISSSNPSDLHANITFPL